MVYSVMIQLGQGSLETGFSNVQVQLKTESDNEYFPIKSGCSLPPASELAKLQRRWQEYYPELLKFNLSRSSTQSDVNHQTRLELKIDPEELQAQRFSLPEFQTDCQKIGQLLNQWLNSDGFQAIEKDLRTRIRPQAEVHILVEVSDLKLGKIPWHLWSFFADYPKAELSFWLYDHEPPSLETKARPQVRVLIVLGDREGVDAQGDLAALKQLPHTSFTTVIEPTRAEFKSLLWDEHGWDIIFYGGHSRTDGDTGHLFINSDESLTLKEFSEALKAAISRGTSLAIFNSCDGLGLAQETAKWSLPATVIMLQLVPNGVAVPFLHHFLKQFVKGDSCYEALRIARSHLKDLESQYPCASWMPGLFRNPTLPAPTWKRIRQGDHKVRERRLRFRFMVGSLFVAAGVIGLGLLGALQDLEWRAYDQLLNLRPSEPEDNRLLIVKVSSDDLQQLDQTQQLRQNFLPESDLERLLTLLKEQYKPRMIGLDFKQQGPVQSATLKSALQQENVLAVCGTVRSQGKEPDVIAPPPDIVPGQIGFSTLWPDTDGVLRRFVYENPASASRDGDRPSCNSRHAFGLLMALNYLDQVHPKKYPLARTPKDDDLQVGDVVLRSIDPHFGGYHLSAAKADSWQMLLNYRAGGQIAETITLSEVLESKISPEKRAKLQNRIILVGGDIADHHATPLNARTPGVEIHAHMTSQILSAVLDGRKLIIAWPSWAEWIWIAGWSVMGGLMIFWRRPSWIALNIGVLMLIVVGVGYTLLCSGIWVPVAAPAVALAGAGGSVLVYRFERFRLGDKSS